jgi:hypothetical protein
MMVTVAAAAGVAAAYAVFGGSNVPIDTYRALDNDTITVEVTTGDFSWTRVADVRETESTVEITVRTVALPLPMASVGYSMNLMVDLDQPLGDRTVVDAYGSQPRRVGD